ncbi:MAG: flippase [Candidatus Daviesbacteria bacterium]|nr:MAG: flippase [Candidatus Daviesbacteria bacterium]
MQSLLKISQQTFWQLIGKLVASVSTFVVLGIVARNYGESGTGLFTLALTYLAIFFQLVDFGFNAHLLGQVHGSSERLKEVRKLLGVRLVWALLLIILAVGLLPFWPFATPEFSRAVILGSISIVGFGIFTSTNLVFQSKLAYERVVIASSLGALAYLGLIIWWANLKLSSPTLLLAQGLQWLATSFLALLLLKKFLKNITPLFDLNYFGGLLKDSWPIAATLGLNIIYFRSDAFIISYFKGPSDVGIYNSAYQVFQTVLVLPAFIMNSYYPLMLTSLKAQMGSFLKQIKLAAVSLLGLALLSTITTYLLSPWIMQTLTGGGFAGASESLQVLSLGFPAFFVTALLIWYFIAKNYYKLTLLIYSLGLIFNLIANLLFIPQGSFIAASWVTVISEYLILALQLVSLLFIKGLRI